jgi:protein-tyrosine phosphatase
MGWIADHYGSKKGMLRYLSSRAAWRFHPVIREPIDLSGVQRLIFVCKGNICRSALAQAVAESVRFPACSYGFLTTPGKPADPGMVQVSEALGYDISGHQTTSFSEYAGAPGDLVLFFEAGHIAHLREVAVAGARPALLGMWAQPRQPYIHDPFGGSPIYYAKVAELIRQSVLNLVGQVRGQNGG